jgi:iron complex transport system permease protein
LSWAAVKERHGSLALFSALLAGVLLATAVGPTPIPPLAVLRSLLHPSARSTVDVIVWQIRLPRVLGSVLVGGGLAAAGLVFQALLKNPLADPYIIGTSSGASLGATVTQLVTSVAELLPLGAFLGATGSVVLAYAAAHRRAGFSSTTVVLVGYALSVLFGATTSLLLALNHTALMTIFFWELGSLSSVTWPETGLLAAAWALALAVVYLYRRELDALALGEEQAAALGVPVEQVRWLLIAAASLVTAVTVSFAGVIGFVGLVSPHVARRLVGASHRHTLWATTWGGGLFLLLCDTLARSLPLAIGELPVGIVTALVGGPFFIWLLLRTAAQGGVST